MEQRNYDRPPTMAEMRKHLCRGIISGEAGKGSASVLISMNVDIYRLKSGGLRVEVGEVTLDGDKSYSYVNSADFGSMLSSLQSDKSGDGADLLINRSNYWNGFWRGEITLHVDSCTGIPQEIVDELLVHAVKTAMRGNEK